MDRPTALTYLDNEYAELATEAQFNSGQISTAYNTAIDMSLRQLGYQESDLPTVDVPQQQILGYLCLLNYYALKRFARLLSIRVNVTIAGQLSAMRSQAFANVNTLLASAEKEAVALGFAIGENAVSFGLGRMELDFLEPSWGEF